MKLRMKLFGFSLKGFCWGGGHNTFSNALTVRTFRNLTVNLTVFSILTVSFRIEVLYCFSTEGVIFMLDSFHIFLLGVSVIH